MIKIDDTTGLDDRLRCFITLTVDGDECKFQADVPLGLKDLQAYVDQHEETYRNIILKHIYPESAGTPKEIYYGSLGDFEGWIKDGCNVPEVLDNEDNVIRPAFVAEKVPWKGTHPPKERIIDGEKLSEKTMKAFESASTVEELKAVLRTIMEGA